MGRKSNADMPTVISGYLYTNDQRNGISLANPTEWNSFLEDAPAFYYSYRDNGFSVRKQGHRHGFFWYAYKRIDGRLFKKYVGAAPTRAELDSIGEYFSRKPVKGLSADERSGASQEARPLTE